MKIGFLNKLLTTLIVVFLWEQMFGHDVPVHQAITANAMASAYTNSSAYLSFVGSITNDLSYTGSFGATNAMIAGSGYEDNIDVPGDVGGKRSLNHFYDPLDTTYGKGLSDVPRDSRKMTGTNSFIWASVSNCLGYNFPGATWFGFGKNLNTSNIWSWQNARGYEMIGLTATNQSVRQANLLYMFRAVGQVMHLLEDASQPQHVRNEQHLDVWPNGWNTPWRSPIEDYGNNHSTNLNYAHSMLDWRAVGFTKLEDFWDRHIYQTNYSALNNAESGGAQLGLAEWCNGNFLGDRHTYGEYFSHSDIRYYPYPSLFTSTDYLRHGAYVDTVVLDNGKSTKRIYLHKTGDGITVAHFSVASYLGTKFPNRIFPTTASIRDNNVLKDYHDAFIPKAVNYSAGLLDYYFRGQLDACIISDGDTNFLSLFVVNKSGTNFYGGTFDLLTEDSYGTRTLVLATNFTGQSLADGAATNWYFPRPTNQPAAYVVVYQGTIGTNGAGAPLDPVDANIAIAATRFTPAYPPDTNGPTPATLDYPYSVDIGEITLLAPTEPGYTNSISFGNLGAGAYQLNYVSGAYWYGGPGADWLYDYTYYGYYRAGTQITYNNEVNGTNGVENYAVTSGKLFQDPNYETGYYATPEEVQANTINPAADLVHMGGAMSMQFILSSGDGVGGSVTYQLQQLTSLYPEPTRVRIQNYATQVLPLVTVCTNSLDDTTDPDWDGTFNYRYIVGDNFAEWSPDGDFGYDLAIKGKMADGIYLYNDNIYQSTTGKNVPGWIISIWSSTDLIWQGFKFTGTTPVGVYYRDENTPMCANGLCCLYIESY